MSSWFDAIMLATASEPFKFKSDFVSPRVELFHITMEILRIFIPPGCHAFLPTLVDLPSQADSHSVGPSSFSSMSSHSDGPFFCRSRGPVFSHSGEPFFRIRGGPSSLSSDSRPTSFSFRETSFSIQVLSTAPRHAAARAIIAMSVSRSSLDRVR